MQQERLDILLAEDSPGDIRLIEEAFAENDTEHRLHVVRNGMETVDFLRKQGPFNHAPRPDLIILDLNLPQKDGREVLAEIKTDSVLKQIPVIVLTVSEAEDDVRESYNLRANCYISKPVDFRRFLASVRSILSFWLTVASLPEKLGADSVKTVSPRR